MFYNFHQNNSGGRFHPPAVNVIIEADSPTEANEIAQHEGLYFDGCISGLDCSCCGDRWYPQWDSDAGDEVPTIYGKPVEEYVSDPEVWFWGNESVPDALVIFKNGDKKSYTHKS